jgi:hypothetical protein
MHIENSEPASFKEKMFHEFQEWLWILAYLAFFFCIFSTYKMMILNRLHVSYFAYGTALINALVLSKVILIGEVAGIAKSHEHWPLVVCSIYKAFVFALLVAIVHLLEEGVRGAWHGHDWEGIIRDMREEGWPIQIVRTLLLFGMFIPFFGFMEIRRKLGRKEFMHLIMHP